MPDDKRGMERVPILGDLPGATTIIQPIVVKELSAGGAQVELPHPLQIDSLHEFRLLLGDRNVVVRGRVAHCRVTDVDGDAVIYRAGIQFVDPPQRVVDEITQFLQDLKTGRRG